MVDLIKTKDLRPLSMDILGLAKGRRGSMFDFVTMTNMDIKFHSCCIDSVVTGLGSADYEMGCDISYPNQEVSSLVDDAKSLVIWTEKEQIYTRGFENSVVRRVLDDNPSVCTMYELFKDLCASRKINFSKYDEVQICCDPPFGSSTEKGRRTVIRLKDTPDSKRMLLKMSMLSAA